MKFIYHIFPTLKCSSAKRMSGLLLGFLSPLHSEEIPRIVRSFLLEPARPPLTPPLTSLAQLIASLFLCVELRDGDSERIPSSTSDHFPLLPTEFNYDRRYRDMVNFRLKKGRNVVITDQERLRFSQRIRLPMDRLVERGFDH